MRKMIRLKTAPLLVALTLLFQLFGAAAAQTQFVNIVTYGQGGNWFLVGGAVAELVNEYVPDVRMTAVPSSGVIENIQLLEQGEAEVAFVHPNEAYYALHGEGRWDHPIELRQLWNWDVLSHITPIALKRSGLTDVSQLRGKRVSVGPPGSASITYSTDLLTLYGISLEDITPLYYSLGETTEGLKDGTVDAAIITLTTPAAGLIDLTTTSDVVFLNIDEANVDALVAKYPFYTKDTLTEADYKGIKGNQVFPAYSAITVTTADMSDDLAYAIVAAVFDHLGQFGKVHSTTAAHSLEGAVRQIPIPLHPGAEKYFREKGVLN